MTTLPWLDEVLSPALVRGVGFALLHSLWQGGALALLLAGALPLLRRRAEVRYALAAGALGALLLAVGLTLGYYYSQYSPAPAASAVVAVPSARVLAFQENELTQPVVPTPAQRVEPYLPLVVGAWLLGLVVLSGRLAGGLLHAGRLRRTGQPLGPEWQQRLAALAARAGLRRPVALLESARVAGPLVLGHLRPAILLPLGAVAGLPPSLLEALLAHELAHVVRRDYLLNLGLAVVEVLFFYHPAVWFMAGCLRAERENCCDDQAAALCGGDRLRVARALAELAELTAAPLAAPRLALAAAGSSGRGGLLARVRRLVLAPPAAPTRRERLLAGALALLAVLGLSTGVGLAARPAPVQTVPTAADTARPAVMPVPPAPPAPIVAGASPAAGGSQAEDAADEPREHPRHQPQGDPRRGRASTVVIEKDKKGRVVNLTVDGQRVETEATGKKAKHGKVVSTEVVRVPARPAQAKNQEYGFVFPSDEYFTDQALQGIHRAHDLTAALREAGLNAKQRRRLEQEVAKLKTEFHFNWDNLVQHDGDALRQNLQNLNFTMRKPPRPDRDAEQADRDAEQADRDARQADRDAQQADRDAAQADHDAAQANQETIGARAELTTRRAELRARMAADAAELRALEREAARQRAPLPPTPPLPPQQGPPSPTPPPTPKTGALRDALRQDGLIDKNERSFTFSLNDKGGKVNGRALTPAQVARYRQLLDQPVGGKGKSSSFTITVNEN